MSDVNHCVWNIKLSYFECQRCGDTQPVKMPVTVRYLSDVAKAFERAHARCKPRAEVRA